MSCEQIQVQLSAALDGELSPDERAAVDQHLADCETCRAMMSDLQSLDLELRRGTAALRKHAPGIAEFVAEVVTAQSSPTPTPPTRFTSTNSQPPTPHIAAAATAQRPPVRVTRRTETDSPLRTALIAAGAMAWGFLLAVLWGGGFRNEALPVGRDAEPATVDTPAATPNVAPAVIRIATGPVEIATSSPAEWTTLMQPDGFACQPGIAVRTLDATVCELETAGGATVRMNAATELAFIDRDDIQLSQGEIWCRTPDAAGLKVTPAVNDPAAGAPVSLVCGPDGPASCVFTCPSPAAGTRISVASGQIEVVSQNHSELIAAGRSVEFRDGAMQPVASAGGLTSQRWMHPLLIHKGPADDELADRVNALLAELGRTKLSYLHERDLRSLGEFGALPLLRFLQSNSTGEDVARRQTAATILADVAPAWMTPELIDLLADSDPAVRVSAATALKRLTGESLGTTPESWADTDHDREPAVTQWRAWWESERQAYPSPPPGVTL